MLIYVHYGGLYQQYSLILFYKYLINSSVLVRIIKEWSDNKQHIKQRIIAS